MAGQNSLGCTGRTCLKQTGLVVRRVSCRKGTLVQFRGACSNGRSREQGKGRTAEPGPGSSTSREPDQQVSASLSLSLEFEMPRGRMKWNGF